MPKRGKEKLKGKISALALQNISSYYLEKLETKNVTTLGRPFVCCLIHLGKLFLNRSISFKQQEKNERTIIRKGLLHLAEIEEKTTIKNSPKIQT